MGWRGHIININCNTESPFIRKETWTSHFQQKPLGNFKGNISYMTLIGIIKCASVLKLDDDNTQKHM